MNLLKMQLYYLTPVTTIMTEYSIYLEIIEPLSIHVTLSLNSILQPNQLNLEKKAISGHLF